MYSFHMFLYFFISGYLFQRGIEKYKRNKRAFVIKKFKILLIPYITLTFFDYGLLLLGNFEIGAKILSSLHLGQFSFVDFLKALFLNSGHYDTHLWFVYALFFIFVINIASPEASSRWEYLVFLLLCSAIYPILGRIIIPIKTILFWSVPFWIGRRWFLGDMIRKTITRSGKQIAGFMCLLMLLNTQLYILDSLTEIRPTILAYAKFAVSYEIRHITGVLWVIIIFWLIKRIENIKVRNCLQKLGDYSYDIYILHQPFLTVGIATVLMKIGINQYVVVLLATMCGVIISMMISKNIIRRIKLLNCLLLGSHQ